MSAFRKVDLPLISASEWNRLMDRVEAMLNGYVTGAAAKTDFPHPWKTSGRYNAGSEAWEVSVRPGLVNAVEVEGPQIAAEDAPTRTRERLPGVDRVRPWLSERPAFPVAPGLFRIIGAGAPPLAEPEPVPGYFAALGVSDAPALAVSDTGGVTVTEPLQVDAESRRILRAVEVILSIPKPVSMPVVTVEGGVTTISPTVRAPSGPPSIRFAPRWQPRVETVPLSVQLATGAGDPARTERRVATFYLLSPPGIAPDAEPDASWTPYARNVLFWQLCFSWRADIRDFPPMRLDFDLPLAGGVGQPAVDAILADLNRLDAELASALVDAVIKTTQWTN